MQRVTSERDARAVVPNNTQPVAWDEWAWGRRVGWGWLRDPACTICARMALMDAWERGTDRKHSMTLMLGE